MKTRVYYEHGNGKYTPQVKRLWWWVGLARIGDNIIATANTDICETFDNLKDATTLIQNYYAQETGRTIVWRKHYK